MRRFLNAWRGRVGGAAPRVVLLSKPECGLCDEAERVVRRTFGTGQVRVVNIVGDDELEELYVFRIPVLMYGDTVLAEGRIAEREAREALVLARSLMTSGARVR